MKKNILSLLMCGVLFSSIPSVAAAEAETEADTFNNSEAKENIESENKQSDDDILRIGVDDMSEDKNAEWRFLLDKYELFMPKDWEDILSPEDDETAVLKYGKSDGSSYLEILSVENTMSSDLVSMKEDLEATMVYDYVTMAEINGIEGVFASASGEGRAAVFVTLEDDAKTIVQFMCIETDGSSSEDVSNIYFSLHHSSM